MLDMTPAILAFGLVYWLGGILMIGAIEATGKLKGQPHHQILCVILWPLFMAAVTFAVRGREAWLKTAMLGFWAYSLMDLLSRLDW